MRALFLSLTLLFGLVTNGVALEPKQILEWPSAEVEKALPSSYPMAYYLYSARLAHEGDKERALFWYYIGELRYRFYLAVNPDLSPDGAPALFGSLHQSVGQSVADPKQIDRATSIKEFKQALDWDAANENKVTSKRVHHKAWLTVRANLTDELEMTDDIKQTTRRPQHKRRFSSTNDPTS
jgi:hypothetical protein